MDNLSPNEKSATMTSAEYYEKYWVIMTKDGPRKPPPLTTLDRQLLDAYDQARDSGGTLMVVKGRTRNRLRLSVSMTDRQIGRIFKMGKFFYLYWRTDGLWWFRFFGKWGFHGKHTGKHMLLFSDRHNLGPRIKIGKWIIKPLK